MFLCRRVKNYVGLGEERRVTQGDFLNLPNLCPLHILPLPGYILIKERDGGEAGRAESEAQKFGGQRIVLISRVGRTRPWDLFATPEIHK